MGNESNLILWFFLGGTIIVFVLVGGILLVTLTSNIRIRRSQRFTQQLIDTTPAYIVLFSKEGLLLRTNQSSQQLIETLNANESETNLFQLFDFREDRMEALKDGEILHSEINIPSIMGLDDKSGPGNYRVLDWAFRIFDSPLYDDRTIIGTGIDVTDRKQIEEEVRQQRENLRQLSSRVLNAQEKEREKIAHELHDDLGQALTAIRINLAELELDAKEKDLERVTERIDESKSLIESSLGQIREMAHELRPSLLDDLGLTSAIRWFLNQFKRRMNIVLSFQVVGEEYRLAREIEIVIYRIIQESCTNIAKHANAHRVEIIIEYSPERLTLSIEDDGKGFSLPEHNQKEKPTEQGFGILGIQERAHTIGGTVEIESSPGHGTLIRLTLPKEAVYA